MLRTILRLYVVLENTIETTMQSIGDIFGFTVHKNKQAYILEKLILIRHTLKEKKLNKTVSAKKKGEIAQRFLLSSP